jgi:hypothetical protein
LKNWFENGKFLIECVIRWIDLSFLNK